MPSSFGKRIGDLAEATSAAASDDLELSLAGSLGSRKITLNNLLISLASIFGYYALQPYEDPAKVISKLYPFGHALRYGAVPDGDSGTPTDNAAAFQRLSDSLNAVPGLHPIKAVIPDGHYQYSAGLQITRPVWVVGPAKLDYTGTGYAVELGPRNLNITNFQTAPYTLDTLTFTGGAVMTQGIYVNTYITSPRFLNISMIDFGNAIGYTIYCQSDNWDIRVHNLTFWLSTNNATGPARNFFRAHGIRLDGTSDQGQSNCIFTQTQLNNGNGCGIGIYLSGVASRIERGCTIAGFSPNVWLGGRATHVRIDAYFESIGRNGFGAGGMTPPCIQYGDAAGHPDAPNWCQSLELNGVYANLHNVDIAEEASNVRLLGPTLTTQGLQYCTMNRVTVEGAAAGIPIVTQNNSLPGQVGNRASGTLINGTPVTVGLLHTPGVSDWIGEDEKLTSLIGVVPNGGGIKHCRTTTGPINAGVNWDVAVLWATPFPDSNYTVLSATVVEATGGLTYVGVKSVTPSGVTVTVHNSSGSQLTGTIHALAVHD